MRINCYITPTRTEKTRAMMHAFMQGIHAAGAVRPREIALLGGKMLQPAEVHVVWGQWLKALEVVPFAVGLNQTVVNIDNGWLLPGHGGLTGYYRVTVNGPSPRLIPDLPRLRPAYMGIEIAPWKKKGEHILICMPGPHFGRPWGLSSDEWSRTIIDRVTSSTSRPIIVRAKRSARSFAEDLQRAWCVVTYASSCAVEAVLAGVPVFCHEACAAAPVARTDLDLENPVRPDRQDWLASLVHQQFTLAEMACGSTWELLTRHFPEFAGFRPANMVRVS